MFDRVGKLNEFINSRAGGSVTKAANMLGLSGGLLYSIRAGKAQVTDDVLSRIEIGHGEYRSRSQIGRQNAANRAQIAYKFDAEADLAALDEGGLEKFIEAVEARLDGNKRIVETAMERARQQTEEANSRIPALIELGRKAVAEITKRKMAKFGVVHKSTTVVTNEMRAAVAADPDATAIVAQRYGISATTVKRIRRDASTGKDA